MPNNSATGGYLLPTTGPEEGDALEQILQPMIVGITGMAATFVRPMWQTQPANLPAITQNWASFGIKTRPNDTYSYVKHDNSGDTVFRYETLDITIAFYGPDADNFANILSMGLQVAQNREALQLKGIGLVDCGNPITVPELIKDQWWYRVDLPLVLRRTTQRLYAVLDLLSAEVDLYTDDPLTNNGQDPIVIEITNPPTP